MAVVRKYSHICCPLTSRLPVVIELLHEYIAKFGTDADISYDVDRDGSVDWYIYYNHDETDAEIIDRQDIQQRQHSAQIESRRRQFETLKKEFGNG